MARRPIADSEGLSSFSIKRLPRTVILAATQNERFSGWGKRYGLRLGASRFVAGETIDDCIQVLQRLNAEGLLGYAVILGESVTNEAAIDAAVRGYQHLARRLAGEGLPATMSMKLTHLGLMIDEELAFESAHAILSVAAKSAIFVRLDMENACFVDATLRIYRRLREAGLANTGVALQAYLYRSVSDLQSLQDLSPNIRLVKGAYLESSAVAFARKVDVDHNYLRLIDAALRGPGFTAVATHDEEAINHTLDVVRTEPGAYTGRLEFQMLYGVRPKLQRRLALQGHSMRVCVPYGDDWYVYFGRRLAERPANVLFVVRSLFAR